MAERNSLLNCRTGNGTEGSNPSSSAKHRCCLSKISSIFWFKASSVLLQCKAGLNQKRIKSKTCGLRVFLSIKLGEAIQEKLSASYSSKLASKCLYLCIERLS